MIERLSDRSPYVSARQLQAVNTDRKADRCLNVPPESSLTPVICNRKAGAPAAAGRNTPRARKSATAAELFTVMLAVTAPLARAGRPPDASISGVRLPLAETHPPVDFQKTLFADGGPLRSLSPRAQAAVDSALLPKPTYNRRLQSLSIAGGSMLVRATIADDVAEALQYLSAGPIYKRAISDLAMAPGKALEIHLEDAPMLESAMRAPGRSDMTDGMNEYDPVEHRIYWNPGQGVHEYITGPTGDLECAKGSPAATLGHELLHAAEQVRNAARSTARAAVLDPVFGSVEERAVAHLTTQANAEIGEPPMLNHHCDFVASRSVTRPNSDTCAPPYRTEDELIGNALKMPSTIMQQIAGADESLRLFESYVIPRTTRSNRGYSTIVAQARDLFLQAHRIVANGGSYGTLRARVNAHMQKALQFVPAYPFPRNTGAE